MSDEIPDIQEATTPKEDPDRVYSRNVKPRKGSKYGYDESADSHSSYHQQEERREKLL